MENITFSKEKGLVFKRFSLNQRFQHILVFITFTLCAVTGLPIKYDGAAWAPQIVDLFGGFYAMLCVHIISGVIMLLVFIYHLIYLAGYAYLKGPSWDFMLKWQDALDFVQNIKYNLGFTNKPPDYGRYSYKEKFDYWAVFWGMFIMGGSGLMMWCPEATAKFFPRWVSSCARIAHSDEAILAILAIFVWHFYNVHLSPDFFPMNLVWFNGKISKTVMEHEHPTELKQIMDNISDKEELDDELVDTTSFKHTNNRILIVIEILFYTGILIWFLMFFLPLGLM
ncbi:formate dehydrogenase subunit gamma [Selenihalanaerobacter shriftii]|uniref:Cytochrome b subunit of formate dehydrogenase n=1 Tax=Selenihalanaerobacter shriftii TaxID=142842 RepID=A0A1T4LW35_9FIRM|nr:cytochrome b/b6 domain-containing protein [Selenihalanaerobacter shriftii]SJZ58708.1 Cytochrome b subunit of formate dehydrogenase [Selenihalanaerobacter shriftii]